MTLNSVTISGRVVNDIQLNRTNKKGISVVNFRLMHNDRKLKHPVYIDVEVWGKEAENLAEKAVRGSYVVVHAQLRRDVWETEEGDPRSKLKLTANKVMVDDSIKPEMGVTAPQANEQF